jgi:signal transduction histidine kinase
MKSFYQASRFFVSIRSKVILPYLLLTVIVAITGAYVVTNYVVGSLQERLNNQLLESGRAVSDSFLKQYEKQVDNALVVANTIGVGDAISERDFSGLSALLMPTASGLRIGNLFIFDQQGQEMLHLQSQQGAFFDVTRPGQAIHWSLIQPLLESQNPTALPRGEINQDMLNQKWYYFTALPIVQENRMMGVVVVGTSLETFLPNVRDTVLADVVIYAPNEMAIASTLQAVEEEEGIFLATLSLPPGVYQQVTETEDLVIGENFKFKNNRQYSVARGVLEVGSDRLGIFAVILPSNYVAQFGIANRNLYVLIFSLATVVVIVLGFYIAHRITTPLSSLVQTSEAIAGGDLSQRTGLRSSDEIGALANSFDEMTERLQQRTADLEKTNRILAQIDRTKANFINISAHELRTPLTLIQGYAYMIDQMATKDPELQLLAKGIMDGFIRMEEVVNNMLDVSKIDSQTLLLAKTDQKLDFIIGKVHKHFKPALKERKIKMTVNGLDDLPALPVDPELMYKTFYHLVMNAIKYTPDGGHITIQGRTLNENLHGHEVEISIRDTGIGIDPQDQELVFEKFYQIGETLTHSSGKTKFKGGGPGLGLPIARGIVQAHGGRIWLESPGHDEKSNPGTVVYVRLPFDRQGK